MSFVRHQIKKRVASGLRLLTDWALFITIVLAGGFGSSWYMVEAGNRLTTVTAGPWVMWKTAARPDADPYTRAHFIRNGALPISTDIADTYLARTDSDSNPLHSSCDYSIEGTPSANFWWSVSVFDDGGGLIPNAADRHSYTSDTAILMPDGRFIGTLARSASPGNWLPTGGAGRLAVMFTAIDNGAAGTSDDGAKAVLLPTIKRGACR
jgi:hypothetical protein